MSRDLLTEAFSWIPFILVHFIILQLSGTVVISIVNTVFDLDVIDFNLLLNNIANAFFQQLRRKFSLVTLRHLRQNWVWKLARISAYLLFLCIVYRARILWTFSLSWMLINISSFCCSSQTLLSAAWSPLQWQHDAASASHSATTWPLDLHLRHIALFWYHFWAWPYDWHLLHIISRFWNYTA